jgi:aryl-alcohol dehydrogenase (NADP+)
LVDRNTEVARKRGVANAQVALTLMLRQPGVTAPIIGASRMRHLEDAVAALELKLDDTEFRRLS